MARSTTLTQDELERMQTVRDAIRLQIFYSRWNLTGEPTYPLPLDDLKLMSAEELPAHGTYWSRQRCTAPLPFNPFLLVTQEGYIDKPLTPNNHLPKLFILHWNGTNFVKRASISRRPDDWLEHSSFAPINLPPL